MAEPTTDEAAADRREPGTKVPLPLTTGLGLQITVLVIPGSVLMPTVVFQSAGQPEGLVLWAVFASVAACGVTTMLQAQRFGRFGAGYILAAGTTGVAIATSISALAAGGPALLGALVIALALFQFVFSTRLSLFRRVLTPTVTGTVMMLTPVTVMPVIFQQLQNVPAGTLPAAAILSALTTLIVTAGIVLKGGPSLRLWAPIVGIVAGSAVGGIFGLYDFARIARASWIGIPESRWLAQDLDFGPAFWALLPAFLFIALVCTIQTISGAVAIQRVSRSGPRAVDFRPVQGAVAADGVGNLLSGLAGTMPLGFRPTGASMVEISGVGSRRIGVALGAALLAVAFLPKALAVVQAIPGPVTAAFLTVIMATIFIIGMRMIVQDGADYRKGMIAGVGFWVGAGCESGAVFPEQISAFAGGFLKNGMIAGGLAAIAMTLFVELTKPRHRRIELPFDATALQEVQAFVRAFAAGNGWGAGMADRLDAVSEETMLTLLDRDDAAGEAGQRQLFLVARREGSAAVLEFVAAESGENLEDRIALLGEAGASDSLEREVSLRLLRHLASSVHHQQYHDIEVVTVRVDPP